MLSYPLLDLFQDQHLNPFAAPGPYVKVQQYPHNYLNLQHLVLDLLVLLFRTLSKCLLEVEDERQDVLLQ